MKRIRQFIVLVGTASALTYFFDPDSGRRRRSALRDRLAEILRGRTSESRSPSLGEKLDEIGHEADLSQREDARPQNA